MRADRVPSQVPSSSLWLSFPSLSLKQWELIQCAGKAQDVRKKCPPGMLQPTGHGSQGKMLQPPIHWRNNSKVYSTRFFRGSISPSQTPVKSRIGSQPCLKDSLSRKWWIERAGACKAWAGGTRAAQSLRGCEKKPVEQWHQVITCVAALRAERQLSPRGLCCCSGFVIFVFN